MNAVRTRPGVSLMAANVCMATVLTMTGLSASQPAQSPLLGRWKFNAERSDFSQEPMVIGGDPKAELTLSVFGQSYRFKLDGPDYPGLFGQTSAWTQAGQAAGRSPSSSRATRSTSRR